MYKTRKIHILVTKEQADRLKEYKRMYDHAIESAYDQMMKSNKVIPFRFIQWDDHIHSANVWYIYGLAKQRYFHPKAKKRTLSSRWHPSAFQLHHTKIILQFSNTISDQLIVFFHERDTLRHEDIKHIIRLDIIYDAPFWFANFLIHYSDEHAIITS